VIHSDIKPANILVGSNDSVKIVDFGLAAAQQQTGSRLTRSGLLIGTPEYMAPELIQGEQVDPRADFYSLGIMLYEMFSGRRPFAAETPVKILFQHIEGNVVSLRELVPTLPPSLGALVERTMARDPDDRPQDVEEMISLVDAELDRLGVARERT
jgi:serine/threonine-protein kinase